MEIKELKYSNPGKFSFDTTKVTKGSRAEMRKQVKEIQDFQRKASFKTYWKYFMEVIKNEN